MVYLREVKLEDSNRLYEICSNKEVAKYLTWYEHKNLDETIFVIKNFYLHNERVRPNSFAIVEKSSDNLVGVIDILNGRVDKEVFEIGYFLDPIYWNKGYATKALNLILDIGFNKYHYKKLAISHLSVNIGSEKVILKNNFKFIKEIDSNQKDMIRKLKYYELESSDYYGKK